MDLWEVGACKVNRGAAIQFRCWRMRPHTPRASAVDGHPPECPHASRWVAGALWRVWRAVLGPVQSPAVPVQGAGLHPAPPSFTLGPDVKITAFLSGKCGRLSPWGDRQLAPLLCARPLPGPPDGQEVSLSLSLCCGHAPSPSAGGRVCEPLQPLAHSAGLTGTGLCAGLVS